ncbi:MAG TPA: aminotransferase class IV [Chryseolinea sp.]|nr:aminotransferase class IV [Chryseolinea sp.]
MSQLLESIRLLDGEFSNLSYHEQRVNRSLKMVFGVEHQLDFQSLLNKKDRPRKGLYKCRFIYDDSRSDLEFIPYQFRSIRTLKAVKDNNIHYPFKFADRAEINRLFESRGNCDDILIIKDGAVTDSSYANIVFRKEQNWYTPTAPLLKGTMRMCLLEKGIIKEHPIGVTDISMYEGFKLINAMLAFDSPEQPISNIII